MATGTSTIHSNLCQLGIACAINSQNLLHPQDREPGGTKGVQCRTSVQGSCLRMTWGKPTYLSIHSLSPAVSAATRSKFEHTINCKFLPATRLVPNTHQICEVTSSVSRSTALSRVSRVRAGSRPCRSTSLKTLRLPLVYRMLQSIFDEWIIGPGQLRTLLSLRTLIRISAKKGFIVRGRLIWASR